MEQQMQNTQSEKQELRAPLSASELMKNLVKAKKVMSKVDSNNFENKVNESHISGGYDEDYDEDYDIPNIMESAISNQMVEQPAIPFDPDKIRNSKLPDVIKSAMINHPIQQQPSQLNETRFSDEFVKNTKRLMEQEGVTSRKKQSLPPRVTNKVVQEYQTPKSSSIDYNAAINILRPIIENIIRESVDKIVDAKMDRLLQAQQYTTLNENLMIKVGDSVFKGNISGATKIKK